MVASCDSLFPILQPPLGIRPLCFRTTVAGRGLFLLTATMEITDNRLKNFWSKVNKTESCWKWTAFKGNTGYGYFWDGKKMERAHRASWIIHNGEIQKGLCVLHKCDNPSCVNPGHLYLGTQLDNAKDRDSKGRGVTPAPRFGFTKIPKEQIVKIREIYKSGTKTHTVLSREFGVCRNVIGRAMRRQGAYNIA